ncbi:MAG: HIT family protein [Lachnospiraceae bacterium]|nr:HIT family protein [Lachnospiraceae bacterium]
MDNCIFCKILRNEIPSSTVYEDDKFRAIMDIGPVAKGHVILLAKEHTANLLEADDSLLSAALPTVKKVAKAVKKTMKCDGINVLQNNGEVAGQTIFHLHIHVIPRNKEDGVKLPPPMASYADGEAAELAKKIAENL